MSIQPLRLLALAALLIPGLPASLPAQETAVALQQMGILRDAMIQFQLDHNYFTTIENLDDIAAATSIPNYQAINYDGGALVLVPTSSQIRREYIIPDVFDGGPPYLTRSSSTPYEGPNGDYDEGTLLDPWGNPYYFYSPLGLIEPKTSDISLRYRGDEFHVYAIVSHGPDGLAGTDDDLEEYIYVTIGQLALSSARLRNAPAARTRTMAAALLVLRGYHFGATQGTGDVLLDGDPAPGMVLNWTEGQIDFLLSSIPPEGSQASVRTAAGTVSGALPLIDERGPSLNPTWSIFP